MNTIKTLAILITTIFLFSACNSKKSSVSQVENGVEVSTGKLNVKVQFYADDIARVVKWSNDGTSEKKSLSVIQHSLPQLSISTEDSKESVTLKSASLTLIIDKASGNVQFIQPSGENILKETGFSELKPVEYKGDKGFAMKQCFQLTPEEGIYGLGQHQDGYFNYRGKEVVLVQSNTEAVNPFLISTKNWGILWDNYSKTIFNDNNRFLFC